MAYFYTVSNKKKTLKLDNFNNIIRFTVMYAVALSVPASFFTSHLINPVFIATSDTFGLSVSNAIHLSSCHQLYVGAGVPVALHQKSIHCSGPPTLMFLGWDIIVGGIGLTKWKMQKKKKL